MKYGIGEFMIHLIERKFKVLLPLSNKTRWKWSIKSEIRFWDKWLKTKGLDWKDEFTKRLDPYLILQEDIVELLPKQPEIKILDVGAGPLTTLGKVFSDININIIAIDPLADEYNKLMAKYNITPIIRTINLTAEDLENYFSENSFDLVFASNSIDHTYSPEKSILSMLKVVKKNHFVYLKHRLNEAISENWKGLHQWNFSHDKNDFIISSRNQTINFSQKYKSVCETTCNYKINENMLSVRIKKL